MTKRFFVFPGLLMTLLAGPVQASPFCVELTGFPLQCLYADPAMCQHEADRLGGICAANPAEFKTPVGGSPFCVVESGNVTTCAYADRGSCLHDGNQKAGTCIAATPATPPKATDPFEVKRPY
jgi:hypothetical protein